MIRFTNNNLKTPYQTVITLQFPTTSYGRMSTAIHINSFNWLTIFLYLLKKRRAFSNSN